MKQYGIKIWLVLFYLAISPPVAAKHGQQVIIAGWLETVVLSPWQIQLKAKLDTGAKTSSIHAENQQRFERDGKPWVRFNLPKGGKKNAKIEIIETPLTREVLIKRHKLPPAVRPVVQLGFCINAHYYETEFTLANRGNFNYPVLLGRRFLKNHILVDAGKTFLHTNIYKKDNCNPTISSIQNSGISDLVPLKPAQ